MKDISQKPDTAAAHPQEIAATGAHTAAPGKPGKKPHAVRKDKELKTRS